MDPETDNRRRRLTNGQDTWRARCREIGTPDSEGGPGKRTGGNIGTAPGAYLTTGQPGLAQRYYVAGLRAAHSADDRPLGAHILGSMAEQVARQGRPEDAVTLIETALAGFTRGRHTPRLLGQLYNWQAWVFAALQDPSACTAAISRARTQAEHFQPGDDPAWLYWVNAADIVAGSGQCLLQLGQADRAAAVLDEGVALFDESFVRDRQIHLTYLTEALARPGKQRDLDAAAAKGIEAIQLAEGLDSTVSVDRIRSLTRQLKPHDQVPAVREFLERAEGVVGTVVSRS